MSHLSDEVRIERGSQPRRSPGGPYAHPADGPKVLVVDDDAWMRSVLADLLPAEGYNVEEASNGTSAIRLAREDRPDVVILDLVMPEMSGLDVLRELKKDIGTNSIPVIVFSAYASQLPADCRPGAEAVIEKPIDVTDLLNHIGRLLSHCGKA